jgi:hypothetical protein
MGCWKSPIDECCQYWPVSYFLFIRVVMSGVDDGSERDYALRSKQTKRNVSTIDALVATYIVVYNAALRRY